MKTKTKGRPITIRLYPEHEELLKEHAPDGATTLGPTVEKLVVKVLQNDGDAELGYLRQKVVELQADLQNMRKEMRRSVEGILKAVVNHRSLTNEDVNDWLTRNLGKE